MAIEYIWKIVDLERDSFTGIIQTVHWRVSGSDGEASGSSYGSVGIPPTPEGVDFTPFEEVTEEDVFSWCFNSGVNKEEVEKRIEDQINESKEPKITKGLPWVKGD